MEDLNFRKGDAKTEVFGSNRMLQPSPVEKIPDGPTTPEIAYQMVKDETFAQTQPRLNLATFVTTYMDEYATKLMNEAININYIDETEYPRIAVMNGKCINIVANLWNSPEKETWKTGALAIGSSEACMLGGVAAWLRWRKKRQAQGKPFGIFLEAMLIVPGHMMPTEKPHKLHPTRFKNGSGASAASR